MAENNTLDPEWIDLIVKALDLGVEVDTIKEFLQANSQDSCKS
ncbi:anti-repressor SinI family protein [Microbacteriaceae bacterium 4G12]